MIESARQFVALRTSDRPEDYLRAANDSAETEVWLEVLRDFPEMKSWVAHNKSVPVEILDILAKDQNPEVRHSVAMKNKLSMQSMMMLASDSDESVRERIVYNKNAGEVVLQKLANDPVGRIASVARERLAGG
jgi:hypothetical protein